MPATPSLREPTALVPADDDEPRLRLGAADRFFWRSHSPQSPVVICAVLELAEALPIDEAREAFRARLASVPRLRCRIVDGPWGERLVPDEDFEIAAHVREGTLPRNDTPTLWRRVSALASEPLDLRRSPWCLDLLQRPEGGGSILVARLHHVLGDGVALMMVLLALTDPPPDMAPQLGIEAGENPIAMLFDRHPRGTEVARNYIEQLMPGARQLLLRGLGVPKWLVPAASGKGMLATAIFSVVRNDPKLFKGPRVAERSVAWSRGVPMDEIKRVSRALGVTINDLLLAAVSGALRQYVAEAKGEQPRDVRLGVPINLRNFERIADLGNRIGFAYVPMPLETATPDARLKEVRRRVQKLRRSGQPFGSFVTQLLMGYAPAWACRALNDLVDRKASGIMTNVPGPVRALSLAGRSIDNLVFWPPSSGMGLGISIVSYAGWVRLGLMASPSAVEDPAVLAELFDAELAELSKLAPQVPTHATDLRRRR